MIVGFDSIKKNFEHQKLAHAYLFTGQDMIGKKTFSFELAHKLAHETDIIAIQSDIDSVRAAKHFLSLSPLNGTRKIAIIDNAHGLTEEAQNALLKILEEPTPSSILILVTAHPEGLLHTIISRCHRVEFFPPSKEEFFGVIPEFSETQKEFLYKFTNGSIGLIAEASKIKTHIADYTALAKADVNKKFTMAKTLAEDETLQQKVLFWMLYLRTKKIYKPLRSLLVLYGTISQPQFNKQLALENFMLEL